MTYAYTRFGKWDFNFFRLLGPGLGNLLFPWARMVAASQHNGGRMLWPTWPQLKIGPILRGEQDKRFYSDLFSNPGYYVDGAHKAWLRLSRQKIEESMFNSEQIVLDNGIVVFQGMKGLFSPILEQRDLIRRALLEMTRPRHLAGLSHDFSAALTIHLRVGDFKQTDDSLLRAGAFNVRLPLPWIRDVIRRMRAELGNSLDVFIFSDGTDEELIDLLRIPGVERLNFGSALADMLAMSRSKMLVVASTFSMWSAYLGNVPSIYYPGQKRQSLLEDEVVEIEHESGAVLPADFLRQIDVRSAT